MWSIPGTSTKKDKISRKNSRNCSQRLMRKLSLHTLRFSMISRNYVKIKVIPPICRGNWSWEILQSILIIMIRMVSSWNMLKLWTNRRIIKMLDTISKSTFAISLTHRRINTKSTISLNLKSVSLLAACSKALCKHPDSRRNKLSHISIMIRLTDLRSTRINQVLLWTFKDTKVLKSFCTRLNTLIKIMIRLNITSKTSKWTTFGSN